jgi:hypothetical protein
LGGFEREGFATNRRFGGVTRKNPELYGMAGSGRPGENRRSLRGAALVAAGVSGAATRTLGITL